MNTVRGSEEDARANARLLPRTLAEIGQGLLRLIYPPLCPGCRAAVLPDSDYICARCRESIELADPAQVFTELARVPGGADAIDAAFALWRIGHDGPTRRVHHLLKYGNRPSYGRPLGLEIAEAMRASDSIPAQSSLVLPVPLHRVRRYERGYNQSATLSVAIAEAFSLEHRADVLTRRRATRSQTSLSRSDRWTNVSDAFAVHRPEVLTGRDVVLVDDVLTTGATITAAARALRSHGTARITAVTLGFAQN